MYHVPVLLEESVSGLNIDPDGVYLDLTFGGGGHSREILKRLKDGCLIGFDQDSDALANVPDDSRFIFVNHNFRYLRNFLRPSEKLSKKTHLFPVKLAQLLSQARNQFQPFILRVNVNTFIENIPPHHKRHLSRRLHFLSENNRHNSSSLAIQLACIISNK